MDQQGGFLSDSLESDVHHLWNCEGNDAYSHAWAAGIEAVGWDEDGMIWRHNPKVDHRKELLDGVQ